ncbi:hypothetical protein C9374_009059 [Naegleria lovaniensis]|uniref:AAA+ ATPase domain-containing protein n=1 Tax=Naegleria lovaniensis TaxID=51637 RepID=A0AA88GK15_NAELO|nr:uncharacterized protein C9374_009059 [Naegleria lovaniensis]KAG2377543.1 hypothetical protein C9374_009059 [Naegleria lovaniensis]
MLNRTFISSKIEMNFAPELNSIQEEMFHEFNSTLYKLHHCSLRSKVLFYGESGIGKTTVMRAALQRFHPNPFIYIDLEAELSWKYLAQSLGISPWNEKHSLKDLIYNTIVSYTTRYKENLINNCPVLILDSANRKPNITNQIIQFLRNEPTSTIALVVLSSYRNYHMINNAGRRVKQIELLEASKSFGVSFLRGKEIPEHLIEGILERTGQKPLYLQTAVELYKDRQTNTEEFLQMLKHEIFNIIYDFFVRLSLPYQHAIYDLANLLINSPNTMLEEDIWLSFLETSHPSLTSNKHITLLFNANLIRMSGRAIYFQNKATENYFKKNIHQLCKTVSRRKPTLKCTN